jgi:type I restriction enzyme R subunit
VVLWEDVKKMAMTPEEKARVKIDRMFEDAGWSVVNREDYSPKLTAAAIREGLLKGNLEADYFLFINGKAVGVLEAKREEIDANEGFVHEQAETYGRSVPHCYQTWQLPLPLLYTSNGKNVYFRDARNEKSAWEEINRIHTPKEVVQMLGIPDFWAGLPTLRKKGLRDCQYEAITELEKSYRTGQTKALMVLATGAGKTYTACLASYRFLAYTPMRRVLFLVDRNNLGKQAEGEFGMFRLTETGDAFNTIYAVNRLKSAAIPSDSNVVISTIQRLFSLLKGEDITDEDDDEEDDPDTPVTLPTNPNLPPDFFDLIIIDECHRSIYGNWRKVLEYFTSARMIGLTATPVPETMAFFNNNRIVNYTLEKSIADGVNVDARIYRIKTEVTENGGAILKGAKSRQITRYTGATEEVTEKETKDYTKEELNRSIVNPAQIKLILETYRDAVYTEMFVDPQRKPNMDYLPKTLIFALNENHATNIVKIAKEVFGRTDDKFVQKITYSAGDSNELIRQFRNDKEFRIAVTCTLVATGTDVKPLEVVMFMRDVQSEPLYVQMKGRGVRTIGDDQLRNVTPNAFSKDCFYLVDCVGVTEHEHVIAPPSGEEPQKTITFKELLEKITHGNLEDDLLRMLASRLSRIHNKADKEQRRKLLELAGCEMNELAMRIFDAFEKAILPPFVDINEPNNERKGLVAVIANRPELRKHLLILNAGFVNILQPGEDQLISKGFSIEEAQETASAFETYCEENKDEIEALRIIYNNDGTPITYTMLKDLENRLKLENNKFSRAQLWNTYALLNPNDVRRHSTKEEKDALTNIIQLVRFAYHQITKLESIYPSASRLFNLWCGQLQRELSENQIEIIHKVVGYIASNGSCTITEIREDDKTYAAQLIRAFGGKEAANEALLSLAKFIIYRKVV